MQPGSDPFAIVPSATLRETAKRVAAKAKLLSRGPSDAPQVEELLPTLAAGVAARQHDPRAPLDRRIFCPLARRLLDLLRVEVLDSWPLHAGNSAELRATLIALERVREAIDADGVQAFWSRLAGVDGAEVLVDIAHDLRSPLTSILFLAETLQRGGSGVVNDVQYRQLGLIYGAAFALSGVANDVIDLARGGERMFDAEPVPFSVTAVLASLQSIVRPIAEEKQLEIRLRAPEDDQRLGHPVALCRVLLNLTTNALKFTDDGYVEIETLPRGSTQLEFAVRDSGRGIDPAIVGTLYQPMRRDSGDGGNRFSQTGLGLSMCRRLVEAMGSELQVETRPNWGTRFFFELNLPVLPAAGGSSRRGPTTPALS